MTFRTRGRREPQLIVVSLVDVVLQLVIFLLLTTTFEGREQSIDINLPDAGTAVVEARSRLTIEVGPEGETSVAGRIMADEGLARLFREESAGGEHGSVTIRADRKAPHGKIVRIVDLARKNDLSRLNIAVLPRDERASTPGRRAGS